MSELQKCVVKALETCSEPTPANIVDSLFNFVRKMIPCTKLKSGDQRVDYTGDNNSAATSRIAGITVLSSTFVTVITTKLQHWL
jgi:hypothetical protein